MQVVARWNVNDDLILKKRGLDPGGYGQKWLDNEVIRQMDPYTPDLNGVLKLSIRYGSVIGSGHLVQATPYARYQYYGVLYVDPFTLKGSFYDPKTGRHWSRPGVSKIRDPAGRLLKYNQSKSFKAGSHWFDRMKADKKDQILQGYAKIVGGKPVAK